MKHRRKQKDEQCDAQLQTTKKYEKEGFLPLFIRLGRPKFLFYSLATQTLGVFFATNLQGKSFDLMTYIALQVTIWSCHLATHYLNEYADVECDKLNKNAGKWTGGSKVLRDDLLPRWVALLTGSLLLLLTFFSGAFTSLRFVQVRHLQSESIFQLFWQGIYAKPAAIWPLLPWSMVLIGASVMLIAAAYSLPVLGRLSSLGLGEFCVAYVLGYCAPAVGAAAQHGDVFAADFVWAMLPAIFLGYARMLVMNIPDREGDQLGGKITTTVRFGERRCQWLSTSLYIFAYAILLPLLPIPVWIKCGYWIILPLRIWQSGRIHMSLKKGRTPWWEHKVLADTVPYVESITILTTTISLCIFTATS
eukprot:TRINITY_DN946_c0_g1_i1.p1 TRINITY_DN946_c0_g1~~TRINITY_DN946_c0_g1_i1.p1  ORF type:complete len:362 (-),score=16.90 TRINITY_DN946_c0_g1_i1:341-1426(-)